MKQESTGAAYGSQEESPGFSRGENVNRLWFLSGCRSRLAGFPAASSSTSDTAAKRRLGVPGNPLAGNATAPLPCIALLGWDHFGMAIHKIGSLAGALTNDPPAPLLLCAVCLERTQEKPQAAVTVAKGFALCGGHAASARAGGFEHRMDRC